MTCIPDSQQASQAGRECIESYSKPLGGIRFGRMASGSFQVIFTGIRCFSRYPLFEVSRRLVQDEPGALCLDSREMYMERVATGSMLGIWFTVRSSSWMNGRLWLYFFRMCSSVQLKVQLNPDHAKLKCRFRLYIGVEESTTGTKEP